MSWHLRLSNRKKWQYTIFKNGKVKISKPDEDLTLIGVRFINNDFESVAENATSRNLLQSVLESDGPRVTANVARFKVLQPEADIGALKAGTTLAKRQ